MIAKTRCSAWHDCKTARLTPLCTVVVGVVLLAMETKDVRQRFAGSQHQKYSNQNDESLPDDKIRRSPLLRYIPYLLESRFYY